jgi:phage gp36-like protein
MFLEKSDLYKAIKAEELAQITRNDDTIVLYGMDAAIAEMKGYLVKHFQTDTIFAQTGTNRHGLLVNFGIDISIYIIVSSALPGQDLEDRRLRYKRAVDWLTQVRDGEILTDLPLVTFPADANKTSRGAYGAPDKRINYF